MEKANEAAKVGLAGYERQKEGELTTRRCWQGGYHRMGLSTAFPGTWRRRGGKGYYSEGLRLMSKQSENKGQVIKIKISEL